MQIMNPKCMRCPERNRCHRETETLEETVTTNRLCDKAIELYYFLIKPQTQKR